MNIGIDIKILAKPKAGIARTVRCLLDNLQKVDSVNHYTLFERRPSGYAPTNPAWKVVTAPSMLPGTLWIMTRLPALLRHHQIDLLWEPENLLPGLGLDKKVRRVVTVHDLTYVHFPHTMTRWNYWVNRIGMRRTVRTSHRLVAVSQWTRNDVLRVFRGDCPPERISVIPNGRPNWNLPAGYDPAKRGSHLLFVGSLEPRKNLLNILRALCILRDQGQPTSLRIAGPSGWRNSAIHTFIEKEKLQPLVTLLGPLSDQALIAEYCACRALVFPSLFEGFGLPVLEALQTDTFVLTSRNTVMEEIGGRAVLLCDPLDPRDIAGKIALLCKPEFNRDLFLQHRREILSLYDWERSARMLLDIFNTTAT